MGLFLLIGILLGLTAIYSVINERYLHLQSAIGLMLLALLTSLLLAVVSLTLHVDSISWLRALVEKLDISEVLLNGVLCFMLFAPMHWSLVRSFPLPTRLPPWQF